MTIEPDPDPDPSDPHTDTRPSPIAGRWYSSSARHLREEVDRYLEADLPPSDAEVVGLIAPHAGYRFSGPTAGHAFATVRGAMYDVAVVLSPLHAYHPAPLLSSAHRAYRTPLGEVPIDRRALETLEEALVQKNIRLERVAYDEEHSLEIELPFLQQALQPGFQLLPLMVRSIDPALLQAAAGALAEALQGRRVLLVGSTDLSHFHPEPAARRLDHEMLRQVEMFSPEGVLAAERSGTGFACGAGAVAAVLWAARQRGADAVRILHYTTSATETGDRTSVVGYGAAVILKSK